MNRSLRITRHAINRFRDRVEPHATPVEASETIHQISRSARACSRPRRWCRLAGVGTRPGSRYLYSADYPGVCLVVRGGAAVTVFSRQVCAKWRVPSLEVAA